MPPPQAAAAPTKAGTAVCQRLSRVRSECIPTSTIAIAVTRNGRAETSPVKK